MAEASGGTNDWRQYRTSEELGTFFPLARAISAKTYQERLLDLGLPAHERFLASSLVASRQDDVRTYLLFLEDEPISDLYCSAIEGVVSYDYLGYDPGYSRSRPARCFYLSLEKLFAERRFVTFDFTEGEGQHKELFATDSRLCGDVYVLSQRLTRVSLVMLHHATDKFSAWSGIAMNHLNLKSRLRRKVRGFGSLLAISLRHPTGGHATEFESSRTTWQCIHLAVPSLLPMVEYIGCCDCRFCPATKFYRFGQPLGSNAVDYRHFPPSSFMKCFLRRPVGMPNLRIPASEAGDSQM